MSAIDARANRAIGQVRAAEAEAQAARVLMAGNVAAGHFNLAQLVEPRSGGALPLVQQRVAAGLDTHAAWPTVLGFKQREVRPADQALDVPIKQTRCSPRCSVAAASQASGRSLAVNCLSAHS